MKIRRDGLRNILVGSLLLAGAGAGVETASAQGVISAGIHVGSSGRASVDLGFFYDDLAPYGNWIERPSYGWVWTPRAVASSWRPYQNGHWVYSDEGWVWVTDEPYGWATYHYGRWYDDPELGWSWVPGDTWGPSWVSFQEGDDYVGWAPLPPGVDVSVGFSGGGYAYGISPAAYLFVPERNFLAPRLGGYYVGRDRIGQFWGRTRNFTNYRHQGGRWYNQGVPVDRFQRFGRVPRYQVADVAANFRQRGGRIEGNRLAMFRPQVQRTARIAPPNQRPAARRAVVTAAQFRAAHANRVAAARQETRAFAQAPGRNQQRLAQRQQRQQQGAVQRQARTAQVERQRAVQAQRQTRNNNVAQRQAQANRQMERRQLQADRQQQQHQAQASRRMEQRQAQASRQQQQRQFQASRQQERRQAQVNRQQQQRQFQASQQRQRGAQQQQAQRARQQQQRQQVQMGRQQQRQSAQQQRQNRPPQQANRGGGPGRQQGRNNHQRPPGPGGQ
jgi:DNA segregation ATPase FtsK/SpoIIIE-like protein